MQYDLSPPFFKTTKFRIKEVMASDVVDATKTDNHGNQPECFKKMRHRATV